MLRSKLALATALVTSLVGPGLVNAQDAPEAPAAVDIERAKGHYMAGAELFEAKDFAGAVKEFKESFRLSKNPLLLYNIAWTYDEMGELNLAVFYYDKFLAQAPETAPNRDVASERVRTLRRKVEADAVFDGGGVPPAPAAAPAAAPAPAATPGVDAFMHRVVDEAPPSTPLDITAMVPEGSGWQAVLYYRAPGEDAFTPAPMKPRYQELVARIPAAKLTGTTVQYYIEVKDAAGEVVERAGRATSPNIVFIDDAARPRFYPDFGDGAPLAPAIRAANGDDALDLVDDAGRDRAVRWGSTVAAGGLLTTALVTWFLAANAATTVENDARVSTAPATCNDGLTGPCQQYSDFLADTQSYGRTMQTLYRASLSLGVIAGGVAGYYWYKSLSAETRTDGGSASASGSLTVVPLVSGQVIGGAATLRF
jgi:hypothetical protein